MFVSRAAARWRLFKIRTDARVAKHIVNAIDREIIKALCGGVMPVTGTCAPSIPPSELTYARLRETVDLINSIPLPHGDK